MKPFKKRKMANMISHGAKQSSRIIINNNKGCSSRYILENIHNRIKDKNFKNNIDEVWLYEKGKVRLIYKKKKEIGVYTPISYLTSSNGKNHPAGARTVIQLNIFRYLGAKVQQFF
jgi:hypothetical protein